MANTLIHQVEVDPSTRYNTTKAHSKKLYSRFCVCDNRLFLILWYIALAIILYRSIYWSDVGSNPPMIKRASMDGSSVRTVVSLNSANNAYLFVFTLDHSRQMLYWVNGSSNCYYTNYIESSRVDGSGRTVHNTSMIGGCSYGYYYQSQTIDFFRGAVYSYSRYYRNILKATSLETAVPQNIWFSYVSNYMCSSSSYIYSGMKVVNPEHQLQGT